MFKIIAVVSLMLIATWSQADVRRSKREAASSRDSNSGSTLWAASLSCDSCGSECASACGTRHFRSCCFNYLRKKRGPDSLQFLSHNYHDWTPEFKQKSRPAFIFEDAPEPRNIVPSDFNLYPVEDIFENSPQIYEHHVTTHPANMSDVNIFYSTPSCYLKSVYLYGRRDKALYTEKADHLPYGSDVNTYWTGFYNSRPSLKYLSKRAHALLQVRRRLLADDGFGLEESSNEEAFGVGLVVRGKHGIFFGNYKQDVEDLSFFERAVQLARKWNLEPWLYSGGEDHKKEVAECEEQESYESDEELYCAEL